MTKRILKITLALFAFIAPLLVGQFIYADYVNDTDITVLNAVTDGTTKYIDTLNQISDISNTAEVDAALDAGHSLQSAITDLNNHDFVSNINNDYTNAATTLKQDATSLNSDVNQIDIALQRQDADTSNSEIATLNNDIQTFGTDYQTFNSTVDTYNKPIEASNNSTVAGYIGLFVITGSISIVSFVWAVKAKNLSLRKLRMNVAKLSLWPSIGSAVTMVWFLAAANSGGGTYLIFWGPIIFGFIAYISAISQYSKAKKVYDKA